MRLVTNAQRVPHSSVVDLFPHRVHVVVGHVASSAVSPEQSLAESTIAWRSRRGGPRRLRLRDRRRRGSVGGGGGSLALRSPSLLLLSSSFLLSRAPLLVLRTLLALASDARSYLLLRETSRRFELLLQLQQMTLEESLALVLENLFVDLAATAVVVSLVAAAEAIFGVAASVRLGGGAVPHVRRTHVAAISLHVAARGRTADRSQSDTVVHGVEENARDTDR